MTNNEKRLLTLKEFTSYVSVSESKGRQLLSDRRLGIGLKIGYRVYADKQRVDAWIDSLR